MRTRRRADGPARPRPARRAYVSAPRAEEAEEEEELAKRNVLQVSQVGRTRPDCCARAPGRLMKSHRT
eukprot:3908878-Prymnesium_polylepis.1